MQNYAELKTAIEVWSHRNDIDDIMDTVIDVCEAEMFGNEQQPLAVRELEVRAEATASSRYIALPARFLSMRRLRIKPTTDLRHKAPESLNIKEGSGKPNSFSTTSQIEFNITPDSSYTLEMLYYQRPLPLSETNDTNEILTNYPNVYLYGCRWAVLDYASEDARADAMRIRFINAIRGANKKDSRARYSAVAAMQSEGLTP